MRRLPRLATAIGQAGRPERVWSNGDLGTGLAELPALAAFQQPVLLLNAEAHVVALNQAARVFLSDGGCLSSGAHPLRASTVAQTEQLCRTIAGVSRGLCSSTQVTLRSAGRAPVALLLMQWRGGDVLAIVHEPTDAALPHAWNFEFTTAESALAADLLLGLRVKNVAQKRGRSVNTIRSQLAAIMKKTNTSSQADLIRVLMQRC